MEKNDCIDYCPCLFDLPSSLSQLHNADVFLFFVFFTYMHHHKDLDNYTVSYEQNAVVCV